MERAALEARLEAYLERFYQNSEREAALRAGRIHTLEVELTLRCHFSCRYCYADAGPGGQHMETDTALGIIDSAAVHGVRRIVWLGGEPLAYPDLGRILAHAHDQDIAQEVWSNGLLLHGETCDLLAERCDAFVLHHDSIEPAAFEQAHGMPASAQRRILRQFEQVSKRLAGRTRLTTVLTRASSGALGETLRYFLDAGASASTLIPAYRSGRGRAMPGPEFLSVQETRDAYALRADIEKRPELMLLGASEFPKIYQRSNAYITAQGDITPYAGIPIVVGNARDRDAARILGENFRALTFQDIVDPHDGRNLIAGACGACENSRHCFGTRTSAYNMAGDCAASDPLCWRPAT